LTTVLEAIAEPRESIMAEHTNYALLSSVFRNAYLTPYPLDMDSEGLLPDSFERAAKTGQSRILYLVPSLQNPTSSTMHRTRRQQIVSIARKHNITIIEDDVFRLLDSRTQPQTIYALAPERTFHLTGLSKTLSPGLRMGFLVAPSDQSHILKAHIRSAASRAVGLTGELARYWIETGAAENILTRIRNEFAVRRDVFIEYFKDCKFQCEPASPFAWLELPQWWAPGRFATHLAARGVKVTPGNAFQLASQPASRHVRICFGAPSSSGQMREALNTVRTLMDDQDEPDFTPVA
jgi:DNA-binding transcriptional MocR family regulator